MRQPAGLAVAVALFLTVACGGGDGPTTSRGGPILPRRSTVWLGEDGIDLDSSFALQRRGVDEIVVRRGSVNLASGVPVLRLTPEPPIVGPVPLGVALTLSGAPSTVDPMMADVLWKGLESELGGGPPAELILDMPEVPKGMDRFIARLDKVAGIPVVPVLSLGQLAQDDALRAAAAARACVVLTHGSVELVRRGAEKPTLSVEAELAPLAEVGARVRAGIVLEPRCEPALTGWGEDLDPLCDVQTAELSTSSTLDRTFVFRRATIWSGRSWKEGDRVAVSWLDASRLHTALLELGRLVLPDVAGWDLVGLPPATGALGLNREAFLRYLGGEGPAPQPTIRAQRSGRSLRVSLTNAGPFTSAVSSYGNWVEIAVDSGALAADDRGDFDRILLGSRRGGRWQKASGSTADAVRLLETYLSPDENVSSGVITLPSSRVGINVRWNLVLSNGQEIGGELSD